MWLLENVGQASESVRRKHLSLVRERRIGDLVVPECVIFVRTFHEDDAGPGIVVDVTQAFKRVITITPQPVTEPLAA